MSRREQYTVEASEWLLRVAGPREVFFGRTAGVFAMELAVAREATEQGNVAGIYTVLISCRRDSLPLPPWVHEGVAGVMRSHFYGEQNGAKWLRKWKKDQEHYERYEMVEELRERRQEAKENRQALRGLPPPRPDDRNRQIAEAEVRRVLEETRFDGELGLAGRDNSNIYATAAFCLATSPVPVFDREEAVAMGLPSPASAATVRRSHALVKRELEHGNWARFYGGRLAELLRHREEQRRMALAKSWREATKARLVSKSRRK